MGGCDAACQGQQGWRALGPLPEGHLLETPGLGVFCRIVEDDRSSISRRSAMKIQDSVRFVTGANRGLGAALANALLAGGAHKYYAAAADPPRVTTSVVYPSL